MMKRIIKACIYLYREGISRYTQPRCIYIPTCSSYALEAIDRFGAIRGGLISVWRILRCNPFAKGGYDPVPEYFTFRRKYFVYCKKKKKDKRR
ncbi:MAG: membrane protein insertion efficiency factor YidD [Candidatus Fimivivens sp.]